MDVVLWYKFTQHKSLKKLLLDTGERSITFVSSQPSALLFTRRGTLSTDEILIARCTGVAYGLVLGCREGWSWEELSREGT